MCVVGGGSACIKPAAAQAAVVNTLARSHRRTLGERKWDSGASSRHLSHPAMATFVSVSSPHLADLRQPRSARTTSQPHF